MMKKILLIFTIAIIAQASCKKNEFTVTDRTIVEGKSLVKLGLFNMWSVAPSYVIYNNNKPVTPPISAAYPYPGGGFNTGGSSYGDYLSLEPGSNKFEYFTVNPGTSNIISKLFETTHDLEANKRYTVYTTDTADKTVAVLAPDDFSFGIDSGYARIRFINLIPNSTSLDFYMNDSLLVSNIEYKKFTEFFDVPASLVDTFAIRAAGSPGGFAKDALAFYRLATNTNKRILSFVARGYVGLTTPRQPTVSVSVNK